MTTQDDSLLNNKEDNNKEDFSLNSKEIIEVKNDLLNCKNCGFESIAAYCPKCGQRTQDRFSLKYVAQELLSLVEFEKGFLKNIIELTFRPAKMIEEYIGGKTKDYYSPFGYFFVSMTIFLFISLNFPISSSFNMTGEDENDSEDMFVFNVKEKETKIKKEYNGQIANFSSQIANIDSLRWLNYLAQNNLDEEILTLSQFKEDETNLQQDSIFVMSESKETNKYSFFYTTVSHQLIDLQNKEEKALKNLEQKSLSGQIFTYIVFYLTPLYLAFIVSFFYSKKKFHFTEHLITQTFITTQLIIFITSLVGVFRVLYWITYFFDKDSTFLQNINIILAGLLWVLGIFGIVAYYFYVSYKLHKQSWLLTAFKCIGIVVILIFVAFFLFIIFDVIFTS